MTLSVFRYHATSRGGSFGSRPSRGRVFSFHDAAVNLLPDHGDYLYSIVSHPENMTARSLLVPGFFEGSGSGEGGRDSRAIPYEIRKQKLVLAEREIDFERAPVFSGTPAYRNIKPGHTVDDYLKGILSLKNRLIAISRGADDERSLLAVWNHAPGDVFQQRVAGILEAAAANPSKGFSGLDRLVGTGIGMTPAGDDFLTGVLLAEMQWRYMGGIPDEWRVPRDAIRDRLASTTLAGRTQLSLALEGHFPAYLLDFVDASTEHTPSNRLAALQAAAEHGATSGRDALAGFFWYVEFRSRRVSPSLSDTD